MHLLLTAILFLTSILIASEVGRQVGLGEETDRIAWQFDSSIGQVAITILGHICCCKALALALTLDTPDYLKAHPQC